MGREQMIPCAQALEAVLRAERLAEWKAFGPVAETARRAAERAEAAFLAQRLEYHRRNIQ